MPLTVPGSLSQKQYQDVTACVLSRNGFVAGKGPLNSAAPKAKFTAPKNSSTPQGGATGGQTASAPTPTDLPKVVKTGGVATSSGPSDADLAKVPDGDRLSYNRDHRSQRSPP